MRLFLLPFAALLLVGASVAACGDDDGDDSGGTVSEATEPADGGADGGDDTADDGDGGADDDGDDAGGNGDDGDGAFAGGFGEGTGTLTIGDETYEITGIGCVFSAEEAGNPDFPFNLSGFGESSTGARAQLSADIYDPSGEERTEGEGVSHNISFDDIEDFQNPSVSWSTVGALGEVETKLTIDGKRVSGIGSFDDGTTDEFETIEGTLEVDCP